MSQEKIEFYKNRTIGERFSAAGDFVRQNWKVLLKNIAYVGVPLALLQGYFIQNQVGASLGNLGNPDIWGSYANTTIIGLLGNLVQAIVFLYIVSVTGAILREYVKGSLTEETGWPDLKDNVFSIGGKIFLQGLIFVPFIILLVAVVAVVSYFLGVGAFIVLGILVLLLIVLWVVIIPPLSLVQFPIFFEDASAWEGIKKGFRLGFRYWGSVFLTILLGGLLFGAVYYIFMAPYIVYAMFNMGDGGILGYILAMFSSLVFVAIYPVLIVFLGFQYTAIVEREEGISLQEKVDEFENL
ncbi:MAG: hypothetical protein LBO74_02795 [Candidatus Symbiothrix sp.]|jgi:hypothetical protein|nr:hypothetical protein [Candidatus Symbiothrix sp.]